jgi:2-polyprenyl-3-methyl-5-hydroxy-6-metoxy-1,4-benzoquinol methylase
MSGMLDAQSIEQWLADVRTYVREIAPAVLSILDLYVGEARFGRQYVADDLKQVRHGGQILEIGAGCMLLSCQLVREGFQVTALEPTATGFSHFERVRDLILQRAEILGCLPRILNQSVESFSEQDRFDYAFSVNVMEHVKDVAQSIGNVGFSLIPGAVYRFTCPNYLFPYEPHFNIPTLFSKRLTEKVLGGRIFSDSSVSDPEGVWQSLNWIDVIQIRKAIKRLPGFSVAFNRHFMTSTLTRVTFDKDFAVRRSKWMRVGIFILVRLRLHILVGCFPVVLQPIIDCSVTRTEIKGLS